MLQTFIVLVIVLAIIILFFLAALPIFLMRKAQSMGINVKLMDLLGMRFRGMDSKPVLDAAIAFHRNNICIQIHELEAFTLAGGDLTELLKVMKTAQAEGKDLSYIEASTIVFSGELE